MKTPVDRVEMLDEEWSYAADVVPAALIVLGAVPLGAAGGTDAVIPIELLLVLVSVGNGGNS